MVIILHTHMSVDYNSTEVAGDTRGRGRPKIIPINLPIRSIYENLRTALYKDFKALSEAEKNRTDTIRLKLIRKAISIPQLILKMTQTESIIKNITLESAEAYYRKTFNHFFNLC